MVRRRKIRRERERQNKPKASKFQAEHLAKLGKILFGYVYTSEKEHWKVFRKYWNLVEAYDWSDSVFEADGKKGLKNVKGNVVAPAIFDDIHVVGDYWFNHPVVAVKDGNVGLVLRDGKGTPYSEFAFADIKCIESLSNIHLASLESDKEHYALLLDGKVFTPFELTGCCTPCNGYFLVCGDDDKWGFFDLCDDVYVSPKSDNPEGGEDSTYQIFYTDCERVMLSLDRHLVAAKDYEKMSDAERKELEKVGFFTEEMMETYKACSINYEN